ncbi:MAG: cob(I)yrinic acid a,c-diamide adenosyltransferase [Bacteroidetes bacterium]|nr:cob(I)yrinic acid a,c-diamide adenosyltransferase [Bacteroidota bacterium]
MKIYTKTGDTGETSLFGGGRVSKSADRIEAYGTVDELNAVLGLARACNLSEKAQQMLHLIQQDLFVLGADLATPMDAKVAIPRVESPHFNKIESWIDELEDDLEPLKYFILPGGTQGASTLHIARTVCRRAERRVISAKVSNPISDECVIYLNRLSDFLFVLSRYENHKAGISEAKWKA